MTLDLNDEGALIALMLDHVRARVKNWPIENANNGGRWVLSCLARESDRPTDLRDAERRTDQPRQARLAVVPDTVDGRMGEGDDRR
jgi:hypothetical protein